MSSAADIREAIEIAINQASKIDRHWENRHLRIFIAALSGALSAECQDVKTRALGDAVFRLLDAATVPADGD